MDKNSILIKALSATRTFNTSLTLEKLCDQITSTAVETFGFNSAQIRILSTSNDEFFTVSRSSIKEKNSIPIQNDGISRDVLEELLKDEYKIGRLYFFPDHAGVDKDLINEYFFRDTRESGNYILEKNNFEMISPLISPQNNELIGLFSFDLSKNGEKPADDFIEALESYSMIAERSIELSLVHRDILESQNQILSFIKSFRNFLSGDTESNIDFLGRMVVRIGAELLNAEACSLYLRVGGNIKLSYSTYLEDTEYIGREKPISIKVGSGLVPWVAATGSSIVINDGQHSSHPAWAGEYEHLGYIKSKRSMSILIVPVNNYDREVIGVISLENKLKFGKLVNFSTGDEEKLKLLSEQLGAAIEIAGLSRTIRQWERKGLQDDLHDLIGLYHSSVVIQLENLIDLIKAGNYTTVEELLPRIYSRSRTTLFELKNIHTSIYRQYTKMEFLYDSLNVIINDLSIRHIRSYGRDIQIFLNCPKEIRLPADIRAILLRITSNIISNAIIHSGILDDPNTTISINVEQKNNEVILKVIDNGIGELPFKEGYGIKRIRDLLFVINQDLKYPSRISFNPTKTGKGITVAFEINIQKST